MSVLLKNYKLKIQNTEFVGCPSNSFLCKKEKTCINYQYVCDNEMDCLNGEDEVNCGSFTSFICNTGHKISIQAVCNHINDCPDGSDESLCGNRQLINKKFNNFPNY